MFYSEQFGQREQELLFTHISLIEQWKVCGYNFSKKWFVMEIESNM